jgi:hypothetical protein
MEIISILDLTTCSVFRDKAYNILMDSITFNEVKYFPIPDFYKYYISRCGNVLSVKRKNPVLMKGEINKDGYLLQRLHIDGKHRGKHLHRFLAMVFLPDFSPELQVDHKDGNRLNNNLSNLRMVTASENNRNRKLSTGVFISNYGATSSYYNGKRVTTYFNFSDYGYIFAYILALDHREEMVDLYYNRPE